MIENLDKVYRDSFGAWLSVLFSAIGGNNTQKTFQERKGTFFEILELWLNERKIRFCHPEDPLNTPWEADTAIIVGYLKSHWPADAQDDHDLNLNYYFYEMPALLWVDEDGSLIGS